VSFEFFENVGFQIRAATDIDDFKQGGQREMVVNFGGPQ